MTNSKFQNSKNKILSFPFLVLCFLLALSLFFVVPVSAADFILTSNKQAFFVDEKVEVKFVLNTGEETINAIEGEVILPDNIKLNKIFTGSSIINFWIEDPKINQNKIKFAGITPGGYKGRNGYVFSFYITGLHDGINQIKLQNIKALLNDGNGTEVFSRSFDFNFIVQKNISEVPPVMLKEEEDFFSPEIFGITITKDKNLFDGEYFIVFGTQDKGSGVDHYEVKEGNRNFVIANSPYHLVNQKLNEIIVVKAVDKAGNNSVTFYHPEPPFEKFYIYIKYGIIILVISLPVVLWRLLRKRF